MSTAIDPTLAERFKSALDRLNPDGGKIGLAVSGGPDSMAMLLLAQEAIPGGFEVATVDHGLRPEAKDECALVVAACEERGVRCEVLKVTVDEGNLQAMARQARYEALTGWAQRREILRIATAHHADDQAETLLMRLNRASGLAGLAGIREYSVLQARPELALIRPLLDLRRIELHALVKAANVAFARDPSNEDENFDRVRIRRFLSEADWLDPRAMSRSAANLASADDALTAAAIENYSKTVRKTEDGLALSPCANRGLLIRTVERAFEHLGAEPRGGDVVNLVDRLHQGHNASLAGWLVTAEGGEWIFRPEPPRRTG